MQVRNASARLLCSAIASAMLGSYFGIAAAQSQPDFTGVSDYLNGQRSVFPDDDLAFASVPNGSTVSINLQWLLESSSLKFKATPQEVFPTPNACQLARDSKGARLFNTANDWIVTIKGTPGSDRLCGDSALLSWRDPKNITVENVLLFNTQAVYNLEISIADLNQDGYEDVIVTDATNVTIFSAVDVNDPSKGLKQVAQSTLGTAILNPNHISARNSHGEVAIADFNADGALDVIEGHVDDVAVPSWGLYGLSVCPRAGVVLFKGSTDPAVPPYTCTAAWEIHKIKADGQLEAMALGGPVLTGETTWHVGGTTDPPRLLAGDFIGQPYSPPQLFADLGKFTGFSEPDYYSKDACDRPPGISHPYARQYELWQFNAALKPALASQSALDYSSGWGPTDSFCQQYYFQYREDWGRVTRLHMSGSGADRDQVVLFAKEPYSDSKLKILTVANDGTISVHGNQPIAVNGETELGMDVGRFDPPANPDGSQDFDHQIGMLNSETNANGTVLSVYSADEAWNMTLLSNTTFVPSLRYPGYASFDGIDGMMGSLDAQGRSVLLGTPIKVVAEGHLQPDLVLAIPPMQVDYIKDAQGSGPSVLNLTVSPNSFSTQYSSSTSSGTSGTTTATTDVGNSVGGSVKQTFSFGIADVAKLGVNIKAGGKATWENSSETKNTAYAMHTDTVTATTGFADHLFYTTSRLNTWYYPVLGKRCADGTTNCATGELQQQYIQFSAPDEVSTMDGDATTQEWYQPVNEPANIFSYPWNLDQLKLVLPRLNPLTSETWSTTDTSTTAVKSEWKAGSSSGITTGSVAKWNLDTDLTVTNTINVPGIYSGGEYNINYGHSSSQKVQNLSTTTLDSTTGIQVNKPGFSDSVATNYFYYFASYILGETPIANSLSDLQLERSGQPVGQQVFGPLTVAFAADPFRGSSSNWWRQAYTLPDIGLNHPSRWTWDSVTKKVSFNQRVTPTNPPNLETTLNDVFYHMKGLFISEDSDPLDSPIQRSSANVGDKMKLTARVYNYSLADMPSGSSVHVRFYGQLYSQANPPSLSGDAFLIGEATTDPIPGFNSNQLGSVNGVGGIRPNWSLVSTTFDTTPYPDKLMVFWVVVWAEDASGKLLPEQAGHGLTQNPAALTFKQITEVPVEDYSNNVGLYDTFTPFYVAPLLPTSAALVAPQLGDSQLLNTNDVLVEAPTGQQRRRSLVKVTIHNTTGGELRAEPVVLYDGDPAMGGKAFDMQRIPHMAPGATYTFRTFFIPETSGNHNIFVRVGYDSGRPANLALTTMLVH